MRLGNESGLLRLVLLWWQCATLLDGKIYPHSPERESGPRRIDLTAAGRGGAGSRARGRREAPPEGEEPGRGVLLNENGDKLDVDVTRLNATNHNEAIVHWSGQKNNVSGISFLFVLFYILLTDDLAILQQQQKTLLVSRP